MPRVSSRFLHGIFVSHENTTSRAAPPALRRPGPLDEQTRSNSDWIDWRPGRGR